VQSTPTTVNDWAPIFVVSLAGLVRPGPPYPSIEGESVTRRIVVRTAAALAAGSCALLAGLAPAFAHGAPVQPISRTAACAGGGSQTGSTACKAARAANGQSFDTFDDLRVPNVNGKDRQVIPDGKLCSGNLPAFKGLDLARTDWPSTTLTAGGTVNVVYKAPIPHDGSFRIYLTKQGYDPAKPLKWSDLSTKPIFTADPAISGGAYHMSGKLPSDRTGRHVLYTIWQTTSTPDTYYSCSDLVLKAPGGGAAGPATKKSPAAGHSAKPLATASSAPAVAAGPATPPTTDASATPRERETLLSAAGDDDQIALGRQIMTAGLIVLAGVTAGFAFLRVRRTRAAQETHSDIDLR
jgi:predicted carbohydrate-binding protein with CBM5 and CBM33 domain